MVLHAACPVTPEVARVWPSTKPVMVAVRAGTAAPKALDWLLAVTTRVAGTTVTVPAT